MKILKCLICGGEIDILSENGECKKVKCKKCHFSNNWSSSEKEPEIFIIRKKNHD